MSSEPTPTSGYSSDSFADEDNRASQERSIVQELEIKKRSLELEIQHLQTVIQESTSEGFTTDQLQSVRQELENSCEEAFRQRTQKLEEKLKEAQEEKKALETRVASLKKTLQNEQRITRQLIEDREAQKISKPPVFPEVTIPDLQVLRDSYSLSHRKRALEDEIRESERQLSQRRQAMAEQEANLTKMIQESKATTAQCEAQIRQETLDLAQLEEMRSSLKERLDQNRQKLKQLESDKKMLQAQIESAEAAQRAKMEEINRNFLAAQREFDELRARKQKEIRELTKQLHENEELNRAKLQEKEQKMALLSASYQQRQAASQPAHRPQKKPTKSNQPSASTILLQQEITSLQDEKQRLQAKLQDLNRKAESNEAKLLKAKKSLEQKLEQSEQQLKSLRSRKKAPQVGDLPPSFTSLSEGY